MTLAATLDEALERFGTTGPEFGGGLSNHGPMAAEALFELGRGDAVSSWTDWYVRRLGAHPEGRDAIDETNWREALGDIARAGDWIAYFDCEVRDRPWADVLRQWAPRLAPGIMAGATHGILRTAHAVRALDRGVEPQRLHELAEGLGYWAARYQELHGAPGTPGSKRVPQALASVARLDPEIRRAPLIFAAVRQVMDETNFAPVIDLVDVGDDVGAFVSDVTRTFVRHYLANAQKASISFIHTVTAPSALRILAPHLDAETRALAMRYAWQACASIYAAFGEVAPGQVPAALDPVTADLDDLIEQAVAGRDEHGIKFMEACLREYRITPDPAFILAAKDAVVRLRR